LQHPRQSDPSVKARNTRARRTRGLWVAVAAESSGFTVRWVGKARPAAPRLTATTVACDDLRWRVLSYYDAGPRTSSSSTISPGTERELPPKPSID